MNEKYDIDKDPIQTDQPNSTPNVLEQDSDDLNRKRPDKEESDIVKLEDVVKNLNIMVEQLRSDMVVTRDTIVGYDIKNEGKDVCRDAQRPLNRIISVGMSIESIRENIKEIDDIRCKIHNIFEK